VDQRWGEDQKLLRIYFTEDLIMGITMDDEIKRWTARRKSALVLDILQGKTTVAEASRTYDLPPSEIEAWIDEGKKGMENALRANPLEIKEQYERPLKDLQEAYGEAMLELRARKKLQSLLGEDVT
jgi:transposase-like protein